MVLLEIVIEIALVVDVFVPIIVFCGLEVDFLVVQVARITWFESYLFEI